MQRIERYGVIALVLLLVTIAAVSYWDDGAVTGPNDDKHQASERLASSKVGKQESQRRAGSERGRKLPTTAQKSGKPKNQIRRSNVAAPKGQVPSAAGGRDYSTLPATVITQPSPQGSAGRKREHDVEFPSSLQGAGLKVGGQTRQQEISSARNYNTIQDREIAKRAKADKARAAELLRLQQLNKSQGNHGNPAGNAGPGQSPVARGAGTPYTVEAGDTLSQIAWKTLGSSKRWREIQMLNGNLDPAALRVGAVLKIPAGGKPTGSALPSLLASERKSQSSANSPSSRGSYVVKRGDVLSRIAQDELGGASRWREIAALNPSINPNLLREGARLRMPNSYVASATYTAPVRSSSKKKNRVR